MARTLPWLRESHAVRGKVERDRPVKRQRVRDPASDEDDINSTGVSTPKRRAIARPARTPSTSPPPERPVEEYMEDGIDGDDAYIMVEDEFEAVARSFTQHLHHAEYIRLKNQAKAHNASTIQTISRPVDTITKMREETKKKKEAEMKATKQKNALQQMKAQSGRPKTDDEESDSDGIAADDPWIGTSLQGLMTSPKKSQTSLTGLGGVKSNTRAAAGYAKAEKKSAQTAMPFDLEPERVTNGIKTSHGQAYSDAATSSDDDLDALTARKPLSPNPTPTRKMAKQLLAQVRFADIGPGRHEDPSSREKSSNTMLKMPAVASSTTSKYSWKQPKSMCDPFDDLPARINLAEEASPGIRKRPPQLQLNRARAEHTINKKTTRPEEIPVFLV